MLLSCGDALVDFLPVKSLDGRDANVPVAGGSCLNIAVGISRLGAPAAFVGGISTDLFGRMIGGEPHYAFYDEATASRHWIYRRGSIPFDRIQAVHVGSTTLADDQG